MFKTLKKFKCRHQDFKVFDVGDEYKSVDKKHTEKLLKLGFLEEVEKPKKVVAKKTTKKKDDAE